MVEGLRVLGFHLLAVPLSSAAADQLNGLALQLVSLVVLGLAVLRVVTAARGQRS